MSDAPPTCCSTCGQIIKNILWIDGAPYGPDCAVVKLGGTLDRFVWANGRLDRAGTEEREAKRAAREAERARKQAEYDAIVARTAIEQAWLADAITPTDHVLGDRCECWTCGVARECRRVPVLTQSERFQGILRDLYAKAHGRRGSKAYRAAEDDFDTRVYGELVTNATN